VVSSKQFTLHMQFFIETHADYVSQILSPSVCLSVCLFVRSKRDDPKVFKLGIENDLGIS